MRIILYTSRNNDVMQNSAGTGKKTRIYLDTLNIRYYIRATHITAYYRSPRLKKKATGHKTRNQTRLRRCYNIILIIINICSYAYNCHVVIQHAHETKTVYWLNNNKNNSDPTIIVYLL